jgi:hypothetical protein
MKAAFAKSASQAVMTHSINTITVPTLCRITKEPGFRTQRIPAILGTDDRQSA